MGLATSKLDIDGLVGRLEVEGREATQLRSAMVALGNGSTGPVCGWAQERGMGHAYAGRDVAAAVRDGLALARFAEDTAHVKADGSFAAASVHAGVTFGSCIIVS